MTVASRQENEQKHQGIASNKWKDTPEWMEEI